MTNMVFLPPIGIFKCMFPFHCITKWIRCADHELFKRPCYLLIILCSSSSSIATAVKDSYRERGYCVCEYELYSSHSIEAAVLYLFAAVGNCLPKNVSQTLEQAWRHKWHTFKLCQCVVILGFFVRRNVECTCACFCETGGGEAERERERWMDLKTKGKETNRSRSELGLLYSLSEDMGNRGTTDSWKAGWWWWWW